MILLADGYLGQMTGKVVLPETMVEPGLPEWAVHGDAPHRGNLMSSIYLDERDLERWNEHLNDKYALDGRDPSTYGGIHWVFGKFDRPFYRRPVFGTVRYMSLNAALGKFDAARYIASMR